MSINNCKIINLPKIQSTHGNLTFAENEREIPFSCKRIYYLYDIPFGSKRGGHAHKQLQQLIIALSGSFAVSLDDGICKKTFYLNCPYEALYICPMVWRDLNNFSSGAVGLVLASEYYDEADYYRDYFLFLEASKNNNNAYENSFS